MLKIPWLRSVLSRHAWANRRSVNLDLLAGEPFVDLSPERALRELIDGLFAEQNLQRNSIYQVSDVGIMLQFVSEDLGVAIVPSALASSFARSKKLHLLRLRNFGQEDADVAHFDSDPSTGPPFRSQINGGPLFGSSFRTLVASPIVAAVVHCVSLKGACERK